MTTTQDIKTQVVSTVLIQSVQNTFKTGCRFISVTYTNANGETAVHNLIMGASIENIYKHDLKTLKTLIPTLDGIDKVACQELIDSLQNSLTKGIGNNDNYTLKGYYTPITKNGEVKFHTDDSGVTKLTLRGYSKGKTVLTPGTYPIVKSSPKTIAKNRIRKDYMKSSNIRSFNIDLDKLSNVKVNGLNLSV